MKIWMDIYFEPIDTGWCLPFLSSHPNLFKKNTMYSTTDNLYHSGKSTKINTSVRIKGKPRKIWLSISIINGIKKALEIPQSGLRKPKEQQTDEVVPYISTFSSNNPPIYNTIKNPVEVRKRNNAPVFESIELISSKQQPSNLKKPLTRAEFSNRSRC